MRRLLREILDAIVVGIIVTAALREWWERHCEARHG
jgi:hypothetical protein